MKIVKVLAGVLLGVFISAASAEEVRYPNKPVTIIVPQAAGGANDTIARIVAHQLSAQTGRQFIVENRPGAGGNLGTVQVARSPRDGYTLLLTVSSAHVINPSLYKSVGFNPIRDFVPVASLATAGYVLVANPSLPANSVRELVALASRPERLFYASAGNGTLNHLAMEMFAQRAGVKLTHVPYKGAAPAVQDVVSGQIMLSIQSLPSSLQFVKSGRLKVLAVVNERRVAALPDTPTLGETYRGLGATPWYGMFAPAGSPEEVVALLRRQIAKALADPAVKELLDQQGCEPFVTSPQQFAKLIADEIPRWAEIIRTSGATIE